MTTRPFAAPAGVVAVSVDAEDWHMLATRRVAGDGSRARTDRAVHQTRRMLRLLREHGAECTFFVLASLAESHPELVGEIADDGHEIASHGGSHTVLSSLTPDEAAAELRSSRDLLERLSGQRVEGFRAPEFSVTRHNPDALDLIAAGGYSYDSSIFPIHHRRYGIPGFPRAPVEVSLPSGRTIVEFPLLTLRTMGQNLPVAGGGYFRVLPRPFLHAGVERALRDGTLPTLYFHPYEFDDHPLRLDVGVGTGLRRLRLHALQNLGRPSTAGKLRSVLSRWRSVSFRTILRNAHDATISLQGAI